MLNQFKPISISTYLTFTFMVLAMPYIFLFYAVGAKLASMVTCCLIGVDVCCLAIKKNSLRSFVLINVNALTLLFFSCYLGNQVGAQYLYYAFLVTALLTFGLQHLVYLGISILICVGNLFLLELTGYSFFDGIKLTSFHINLIHYFAIGTTFLLIIVSILFSLIFKTEEKESSVDVGRQLMKKKLTSREIEITTLLLTGKSNKDIAAVLFVEESTIKSHLKSIFKKMNVNNRNQLMACMLHHERDLKTSK